MNSPVRKVSADGSVVGDYDVEMDYVDLGSRTPSPISGNELLYSLKCVDRARCEALR